MELPCIGGEKYWFVSMVFVEPLVSTKRVANWKHIVYMNFHCRHLVKNACAHDVKNACAHDTYELPHVKRPHMNVVRIQNYLFKLSEIGTNIFQIIG